MHYDWLACYQDFNKLLPHVSDRLSIKIDTLSGEVLHSKQDHIEAEGSYSTKCRILISDNRLYFSGNPSRFDRLDNLFGFAELEHMLDVANWIIRSVFKGFSFTPQFTKNTDLHFRQSMGEDSKAERVGNGVQLTRIDITSNQSVGKSNGYDYLKAISSQRYRHSLPFLYPDGCSVTWHNKKGHEPRLIVPTVYLKAQEIDVHLLPRIKRMFGDTSPEFSYVKQVRDYCEYQGTARFEQKIKADYLRRKNWNLFGLFDEREMNSLQNDFLSIDERLKVTSMDLETISERLIRGHVCKDIRSANTTAMYAIKWMSGGQFDFAKSQVKTHRARLRKVGIDIAQTADLNRHSPILIRKLREVEVKPLSVPSFYRMPMRPNLKLVA